MAHTIEPAKSGRAACRTCRQPIAKGELRFGEEVPNAFSDSGEPSYQWHHLPCAATKKPAQLKLALASFTGEVPGRAELEKTIEAAAAKVKPATFPYAERAPTGRSKCQACEQPIEKGALRVAIEREVDTGSFVTKGAGYLHAACARAHTGDDALMEKIQANSPGLKPEDQEALALALRAPS
jgi:poly [ADP-ribose] polymerase